jgi:F-type H+-transporting ATPase subunit a
MFVAIALLFVVMFVFKKKQAQSLVPQGFFVNGMEYLVVEFTRDDMCKSILGDTWKKHFPFIAALFFFILFNNIVGIIPGCHPGTGTIGVTAALALCSFVYFIAVGIKRMGVLGATSRAGPQGLGPSHGRIMVWVIELFSTFLRLITLAVRLFCNMFAGHVVMGTFAILASLFFEPLLQGFSAAALGSAAARSSGCSSSSSSTWSRFWSP